MARDPDLGAAIHLVLSPQGIPFVRNPKRGRVLWRLPGGHIEEAESPEQCACRETMEETGYIIPVESTKVFSTEFRGTHKRHFCVSRVERLEGKQHILGDGGEETKLFTVREALDNHGVLNDHRRVIRELLEQEFEKEVARVT